MNFKSKTGCHLEGGKTNVKFDGNCIPTFECWTRIRFIAHVLNMFKQMLFNKQLQALDKYLCISINIVLMIGIKSYLLISMFR